MTCPTCYSTNIDFDDISNYNTCLECGEFWNEDSIDDDFEDWETIETDDKHYDSGYQIY